MFTFRHGRGGRVVLETNDLERVDLDLSKDNTDIFADAERPRRMS